LKKLYLLLILFLLFIVGCSNETPKTEGEEIVKTPNKDEILIQKTSKNKEKLKTILDIIESDWQKKLKKVLELILFL